MVQFMMKKNSVRDSFKSAAFHQAMWLNTLIANWYYEGSVIRGVPTTKHLTFLGLQYQKLWCPLVRNFVLDSFAGNWKWPTLLFIIDSLLSSLAHTRAGIPDAMVTSGAMERLMYHLSSPYDLVRTSCAVALGYLSFNKTAARILLSSCRNNPGLHDKLIQNIDADAKISDEFIQDFERAKKIGLPSQR